MLMMMIDVDDDDELQHETKRSNVAERKQVSAGSTERVTAYQEQARWSGTPPVRLSDRGKEEGSRIPVGPTERVTTPGASSLIRRHPQEFDDSPSSAMLPVIIPVYISREAAPGHGLAI